MYLNAYYIYHIFAMTTKFGNNQNHIFKKKCETIKIFEYYFWDVGKEHPYNLSSKRNS
jgi:hypothetical protein